MLAFWKGNGANVIRIFPYSAAQLAANDTYKRLLAPKDGRYVSAAASASPGALLSAVSSCNHAHVDVHWAFKDVLISANREASVSVERSLLPPIC